jgi:hypothetical protein
MHLALAAVLLPVLVVALGSGLNQYACQAPGIHGLCQHYGWGGIPTLAQEAELTAAAAQGCDGLRQFLRGAVPDRLCAKAQAAIDARRTEPYQIASKRQRRMTLPLAATGGDKNRRSNRAPRNQPEQAHG